MHNTDSRIYTKQKYSNTENWSCMCSITIKKYTSNIFQTQVLENYTTYVSVLLESRILNNLLITQSDN